ncbi:alkylhydroperoxidase AhpD family core domain containing protein [Acidovorax sp. CF316]|uniref:carboxymuconolactone decarboxylase family protein n=1 Tax=Acidovorax sp. CF316 TaxID=1144317 RepID=UPI00026BCC08|nr:carboxymuconolactone decarboxylase family protein [Acidovorax sp. CF316]EJE49626.1 alkylhydroperoxidase AhpD family core domain containing protein [Acidovorax sp. CF316]
MSQRLDHSKIAPNAAKGFYAASAYLSQCGLPTVLIDLVYLRVSQINGCAYCVDLHSRDLLKHGVSVDKLVLVPVWREAGALFDARESAALAWAEVLARVDRTGAPDEDFAAVSRVFSEREVVDLTMAICLMSAFNRLGVGMRLVPQAAAAAAAAA